MRGAELRTADCGLRIADVRTPDNPQSAIRNPQSQECVFCTRREQPEILFETRSLYVVPDKFPLLPGHVLVISKEHRRCHAEAPAEAELEAAAERARAFLQAAYGVPVLTWENGICGQTVYHAHLHVIPRFQGDAFRIQADWDARPPGRS